MARLSRDDILAGWARLGEFAHAEARSVELLVVGGAVMAVHFRSRGTTADVDCLFAPGPETRRWATSVAEEMNWSEDWLNDGAKGFVVRPSYGPLLFERPGIKVHAVSLPHLLALKLMAWRDDVDFGDGQRIFEALEQDPSFDVSTKDKLSVLLAPFFLEHLRQKAAYALEELWEITHP